jgi:UDP-N-acetylmuramoyl-L-alanyl-D-glutamate--2,6-diaminopimelate ligase
MFSEVTNDLMIDVNPIMLDTQISGLCDDSRKASVGKLFFAIPGSVLDGSHFIKDALKNGASVVVSESEFSDIRHVQCKNVNACRYSVSKKFFNNPYANLEFYGVTGTNGKTTIATLLQNVFSLTKKVALLGTIENVVGGKSIESKLTTPGVIELMSLCKKAVDAGDDAVVMEVSSHAIHQNRIEGIKYRLAIFTNLTQDHLDYHGSMEEYFTAKKRLFSDYIIDGGAAIINTTDLWGKRLFSELEGVNKVSVSATDSNANYFAEIIRYTQKGMLLKILAENQTIEMDVSLTGSFNVENILCVIAASRSINMSWESIKNSLESIKVPGRLESVYSESTRKIFVDYAHTPDALERVLKVARELSEGRVIVVFGCGGDRDKTKRPIMGAIASKNSDLAILTSDNPRSEDPNSILKDVLAGIIKDKVVVVPDRREAIQLACDNLENNDVLIIAGKGHEDYQILENKTIHFDDREEVRSYLRSKVWN